MVSDSVLSVETMLANAKAAAQAKAQGRSTAGMSEVEKLLAKRETPIEDIVELSPVQKLLQAKEQESSQGSYFESDDYIRLKVQQLQGQLATFATLPGLDPDGSTMASIQAEIEAIIQIQQADFAEIEAKQAEAAAEQAEKDRLAALEGLSPEDLLANLRGETPKEELSNDVKNLLRNVGSTLDLSV
jgi:hypothetical protein